MGIEQEGVLNNEMGGWSRDDVECKGRCAKIYENQSFYKTKNNTIRIDNIMFNFAYLGFMKCNHCRFAVMPTSDKKCGCCGYKFSMRRSSTNTSNYEPYEETRNIHGYGYHMMPGFAEMKQQFMDEAKDKTPYQVKRKKKCVLCGTTESRFDEFGIEQWFRANGRKDRHNYICSACYYKKIYHENERAEYHSGLRKKKRIRLLNSQIKQLVLSFSDLSLCPTKPEEHNNHHRTHDILLPPPENS